jgi:hypothetical protein
MKWNQLLLILILISAEKLFASPVSDLNSLDQKIRDATAEILRTNYVAPSRTNWDAVINSITNGMTKTNILKILSPYKITPMGGAGSGTSYSQSYQFDDAWMLICWFREFQGGNDVLLDRQLSPSLRYVWVNPPTNFSGTWITYYVNGQKSHEIHFDQGKYDGEFVAYNPDGSKCYVQHYNHQIGDGDDTGYFGSGRIKYHGVYKDNKQVGLWVWYNEDGSTNSTKDYSTATNSVGF